MKLIFKIASIVLIKDENIKNGQIFKMFYTYIYYFFPLFFGDIFFFNSSFLKF